LGQDPRRNPRRNRHRIMTAPQRRELLAIDMRRIGCGHCPAARMKKQVWLSFLLAGLGLEVAWGADFATEMVEATHKLMNPTANATCFLVRRPAPDRALYLVTAAHALEKATGETSILVLRERQSDGTFHRRDEKLIVRRDSQSLWVRHPSEDVAVLRLAEPLPVPVNALPISALADEPQLTAAGVQVYSS
jgi:hypothetical protein